MKAPESLETLVDYGIIQEVVRPLMSGKEAQVYVVVAGGEECVAKVYKEATQRTFKHRSDYTEGRRTRNTRDQRAISKRTQHGRQKDEDAWRSTEVDMIYRLRDAGVRVPEPRNFVEGVLVMELVKDSDGDAAPRLGDLTFSPSEAREIYHHLLREVVRMLCAGVIHGDLSDFNVLMSHDGPVVIDFPQSVEPTHNPNGKKLLLRDVANLDRFLKRFAPDEPVLPHGEEIWSLYQANRLEPDSKLTGRYRAPEGKADIGEVMALIEDADRDEARRRGRREPEEIDELDGTGEASAPSPAPFRKVVDVSGDTGRRPASKRRGAEASSSRPARRRRKASDRPVPPAGPASARAAGDKSEEAPAPRRRRRSRRGRPRPAASGDASSDEAKPSQDAGASRREARSDRASGRTRRTGARDTSDKPRARSGAKRPADAPASPKSAQATGKVGERDRPARRRRRRAPRRSSTE